MNDFDYDVMQKKNIARGAYHRKGGSKSKKCSLPSDLLTPAQKRALNGPVTTVKLGQPMSWEAYKSLSDTLKKEYLEDLIASYQVSGAEIGRMFGVSVATMSRELRRLSLKGQKGECTEDVFAHKAKWAAFCNGVVGGAPGAPGQEKVQEPEVQGPEVEPGEASEEAKPEVVPVDARESHKAPEPPKKAGLVHLRTTFDGVPNLKQLEDLFTLFVQLPREVTVTIEVTS